MSATAELIKESTGIRHDELEYQLEKRGLDLDLEEVERLIENGLVEDRDGIYWAIVPERRDRRGPAKNGFSDEGIIDRVRLWSLVTGKPPSKLCWHPFKAKRQIAKLQARVAAWQEIVDLYEAGDWPSETTVRDHFGSLNAALVVAGFEPRAAGRQPKGEGPIRRTTRFGREALREAFERTAVARAAGDQEALREALTDLAIAAFTEADRL